MYIYTYHEQQNQRAFLGWLAHKKRSRPNHKLLLYIIALSTSTAIEIRYTEPVNIEFTITINFNTQGDFNSDPPTVTLEEEELIQSITTGTSQSSTALG